MGMVILCAYVLVGVLVGGAVLVWQYFYSSSGEIRGDDLFVALLFTAVWPVALFCFIVIKIGKLFSHSHVIARRKK
ncbi:membrane protein [Cronobacter phage vB_CsaM_GAP31]|uniref:Transmembrane protein n=1 Tax=Cronobacter phage vB_CsaM_GAP31 TaxID=1141135 RepID=K4FAW4_9CAUD|nr:membrane protein [Cronobacter phage vB_CsaM_GAP31]AFC21299.1 hypothetical protein GAP31_117 [Cronobacter phage vB_CsaM_GAP31]